MLKILKIGEFLYWVLEFQNFRDLFEIDGSGVVRVFDKAGDY